MGDGQISRKQLKKRLQTIELLSLDVDGVLTDGGLYYIDDGHQMRKFNVKDGMGIVQAMKAGLEICIISASKADVVSKRASDLGIKHVYPGSEDKLAKLSERCAELSLDLKHVAHIGDDINDLPVLKEVGLSLTVADAVDDVRGAVDFITSKEGGKGAVREICDLIVEVRR